MLMRAAHPFSITVTGGFVDIRSKHFTFGLGNHYLFRHDRQYRRGTTWANLTRRFIARRFQHHIPAHFQIRRASQAQPAVSTTGYHRPLFGPGDRIASRRHCMIRAQIAEYTFFVESRIPSQSFDLRRQIDIYFEIDRFSDFFALLFS